MMTPSFSILGPECVRIHGVLGMLNARVPLLARSAEMRNVRAPAGSPPARLRSDNTDARKFAVPLRPPSRHFLFPSSSLRLVAPPRVVLRISYNTSWEKPWSVCHLFTRPGLRSFVSAFCLSCVASARTHSLLYHSRQCKAFEEHDIALEN